VTEGDRWAATHDRLGFLLARHGQVMNTRLRQALGVSGLSPRHAATLFRLAQAGPTSQQGLIEVLAVDASALVAVLNDLEGNGRVERRRDPTDRRRHIVQITPVGAAAVAAVEAAITAVENEALADLGAGGIAQLHGLLARIRTRHDLNACDGQD
jgi:DNA-binding MarR family transcriptional regulator